ncbi:hypothetical protein HaLaN_24218 [Haematococcus lacustris]|uniref:Uncharacterized protein n=1 Tax=Haematococcus lacustris TaxID=44745 RepID=A0A699ZTV7_HAELA|nr:hypothetical protein HaLaN_24218 [Haematococcus lacustris]
MSIGCVPCVPHQCQASVSALPSAPPSSAQQATSTTQRQNQAVSSADADAEGTGSAHPAATFQAALAQMLQLFSKGAAHSGQAGRGPAGLPAWGEAAGAGKLDWMTSSLMLIQSHQHTATAIIMALMLVYEIVA